jgi:hypothetical protein
MNVIALSPVSCLLPFFQLCSGAIHGSSELGGVWMPVQLKWRSPGGGKVSGVICRTARSMIASLERRGRIGMTTALTMPRRRDIGCTSSYGCLTAGSQPVSPKKGSVGATSCARADAIEEAGRVKGQPVTMHLLIQLCQQD